MSFVRTGFLILLAMLVQGCETVPAQEEVVVKADTVLVLPAESLHAELDRFSADVQQRLAAGMQDKGFKVLVPGVAVYQQLRAEALTVSGSMYQPEMGKPMPLNRGAYNKALIDLAREKFDFDVVVLPELVLRKAETKGDEVVWDGVERDITWVEKPQETYNLPQKATGLSLRLGTYTDKGGKIQSSFSGISLPYDLRYDNGKFLFKLKDNFFTEAELREGIKLALKTFYKQVKNP